MAVYLASDESRSTIGSVMVVDGGMTENKKAPNLSI